MDGLIVGRAAYQLILGGPPIRHRVSMVGPSYAWTVCNARADNMVLAHSSVLNGVECRGCCPALKAISRRQLRYYGEAGCRFCGVRACWELIADGDTVGYACAQHAIWYS